MSKIAVCPLNKEHKRFATVAHVQEDWVVDENGDFLEARGTGDVVSRPDRGNVWSCLECGEPAKHIEVEGLE